MAKELLTKEEVINNLEKSLKAFNEWKKSHNGEVCWEKDTGKRIKSILFYLKQTERKNKND